MRIEVLSHCWQDEKLYVTLIERRWFRRTKLVGVTAANMRWRYFQTQVWVFDDGEPVYPRKYWKHTVVLQSLLLKMELRGELERVKES